MAKKEAEEELEKKFESKKIKKVVSGIPGFYVKLGKGSDNMKTSRFIGVTEVVI